MLHLQNIHLAFGGEPILDGLTWTVQPGRRIGLVGKNGAGKTTLLRLISGRLQPDEGRIERGKTTVGYLEQDLLEATHTQSVREEALKAFEDVQALEKKEQKITDELGEVDHTSERYAKLLDRLERIHTQLHAREAHTIVPRTDAVLTGLGFDPDALDRPLSEFSGGWRMRATLARLLLMEPDVLLLDEPTNHLDIVAIDWLEGYLNGYPGTLVIVSHDRRFLDRMTDQTVELHRGKATIYEGNYTSYVNQRQERWAQQRAAYENQQREIKEIERFVERFRYNASKASQVQSRVKRLEKMERLAPPPEEDAAMKLTFPAPPRSGEVVLELSSFSKTYQTAEGPLPVFDDADGLHIGRGDQIALIGANGAGKSTLARILLGEEEFEGERRLGHKVLPAHFAQHQAESLNPVHTVLDSLRERAPRRDETELRDMAGAFLFTGDDVFKEVGVLSGGERNRVALARTLLQPANFLVLDEPTNHLDIQSTQVLIEALQQYEGTFVVVSHDRHFLDQVAEQVWSVGGGRVQVFPGTYEEYRWQIEHGSMQITEENSGKPAPSIGSSNGQSERAEASASGPKSKEQKRLEAEERQRRKRELERKGASGYAAMNDYQLNRELEKTETAILKREERQEALEGRLADPSLYDDPDEARSVNTEYDEIKTELADLYDRWEQISEHLISS